MFSSRALRHWSQMVVNTGVPATARLAVRKLRQRLRPRSAVVPISGAAPVATAVYDEAWQTTAIHPFDRQHGVETSGLIWSEELRTRSRSGWWSTAYYGIAPSVFQAALAMIDAELAGFTFVDIGSGKGRAVMLATRYPFAAVYGVELSPELHRVAERNVAKFLAPGGPPVVLRNMDAVRFELPEQPLVLYFYHPFCKPVLRKVLANLERSLRRHPRPAYVVYVNTELREVLEAAPFLERVAERAVEMSAEDRLADRIGSSVEECAVYRSRI